MYLSTPRGTGLWAVYSPVDGEMKARKIVVLLSCVAALGLFSRALADDYHRQLFERLVYLMETNANPDNLLAAFQEIAERHPYDRYYAARSQLYAGICYKRMGADKAVQAFQKVIADFPDQVDVVKIAEAELAGLNRPKQPASKKSRETNPVKVWEGKSVHGTETLSHDGRYLCYVDQRTGDLMLSEIASGKTRRLLSHDLDAAFNACAEDAEFSPDARQIAFSRRNGRGECELCLIGTDGSGQRTLYHDENMLYIHLAGWTADGGQILATLAKADLTSEIVLVSVSNGSMELVRKMASQWPDHLRLSPDGRYLAYGLLEDTDSPERDIFLYDLEKDQVVPLVVQPGDDLPLDWVPDGHSLLFTNSRDGITDVWIIPVGEREPRLPARRIRSNIGRVNPIGLARDGRFYYKVEVGGSTGPGGKHPSTQLWAIESFLPEGRMTLTVPDDYPTIQAAVDNASPGATVFVRKGEYRENIIVGKALTLEGEDRETTVINGNGSGVVLMILAGRVIINGFTVRDGDYGVLIGHLFDNGVRIGSSDSITHVTLRDMIVTLNKTHGVCSWGTGGHHIIENCIISFNAGMDGIHVHQVSKSTIRNCEVFANGKAGLTVGWSWHVVVEGNKIYHNPFIGLSVDSCYYATIKNNLISANERGMYFHYISRRSTVKENIVFGSNLGLSIDCSPTWIGAGENIFYHNDFIGNQEQIYHTIKNQIWDNGYPSGGNYWSDYEGQDQDDDGIGDAPHEMAEGAKDNFPLVKPWNRVEATVEIDSGRLDSENKESWIIARIALSAGISGDQIDPSTVLLNDSVSPEKGQYTLADCNDDGIPDMMVRFKKEEVSRILLTDENKGLTISGRLKNGLPFAGTHSRKIK